MTTTLIAPRVDPERITDSDVREREEGSMMIGQVSTLSARHERPLEESDDWSLEAALLVVVARDDPPAWLVPTVEILCELLSLQENWDSYGAPPVASRNVQTALEVLSDIMRDDTPMPQVIPTSRGGVQLEWHTRGIDLEIETISPFKLDVLCEDLRTGEKLEEEVWLFDMHRLAAWVGRLS